MGRLPAEPQKSGLVNKVAESAIGEFFKALEKLRHLAFAQNVPCPALVIIGLEVRMSAPSSSPLSECFVCQIADVACFFLLTSHHAVLQMSVASPISIDR